VTYEAYGDDVESGGGRGGLITAWLLFIALLLGIAAWLFAKAADTSQHSAVPMVRMMLPEQVGETTRSDGTTSVAEAAPAAPPVAAAPAPVVLPPTTTGKIVPKPPKDSGPDAPPAPRAAPRGEGVSVAPLPATPAPVAQAAAPQPSPAAAPQIAAVPAPDASAADHQPLPHGPNQALLVSATYGQLPIIGPDGAMPWKYYQKPFAESDRRPRIAVVVTGLGLNATLTQAAISRLPGSVTLAFDPYADGLNEWMSRARAQGHEVLIGVPMEPLDYPESDPGPATLLTSLTNSDNKQRLEWTLARATGYVGVVGEAGSRFLTSPKDVLPLFDQLKQRGLLYVDNMPASQSRIGRIARDLGLARALDDLDIDTDPSAAAIDAKLMEIEKTAKAKGQAVAFASPMPGTFKELESWTAHLSAQNLVLAPITAVVNRQADAP
jgi:polysaccharide deacetylase 2 family uncharacterized protein YibQ